MHTEPSPSKCAGADLPMCIQVVSIKNSIEKRCFCDYACAVSHLGQHHVWKLDFQCTNLKTNLYDSNFADNTVDGSSVCRFCSVV